MKWISVKDRLPEKEGQYFCWDEPYSSSTGKPVLGIFMDGVFKTDIADDWTNVTHWLLPDPPESD